MTSLRSKWPFLSPTSCIKCRTLNSSEKICGFLTKTILDGDESEIQDIHKIMNGKNFKEAAKNLCKWTRIIATNRNGPYNVEINDCYDGCADVARCESECGRNSFCCSEKDKTSDRGCPEGKLIRELVK